METARVSGTSLIGWPLTAVPVRFAVLVVCFRRWQPGLASGTSERSETAAQRGRIDSSIWSTEYWRVCHLQRHSLLHLHSLRRPRNSRRLGCLPPRLQPVWVRAWLVSGTRISSAGCDVVLCVASLQHSTERESALRRSGLDQQNTAVW